MRTRAIYGCAGLFLTEEEKNFFRGTQPWGFILFARNVADPGQVRRLCDSLRETVGDRNAPILIDQEGGRVARLKPPNWHERPAARVFGELFERDSERAREAAYLNARLIAHDLSEIGVNVDCLPVLDVPAVGASDVIGDRAFSVDTSTIIELGRAVIAGLVDGGVIAVMKHIPGHGRATVDSHLELPRVAAPLEDLSASDFVPFRSLNFCPAAMTAHVIYEAIDSDRPATTSARVIRDVIRSEIDFDGLLISDDLSMNALSGALDARTRSALSAGCDIVLHCNGRIDEMRQVASEARPLEGLSLRRAHAALAQLVFPAPFDSAAAESRLESLMEVTR